MKKLMIFSFTLLMLSSLAQAEPFSTRLTCTPSSVSLPGPSSGIMTIGIGAVFISATIGHYLYTDLICNLNGDCTGFANGSNNLIQAGASKLLKDNSGQPTGFKYGTFSFTCR